MTSRRSAGRRPGGPDTRGEILDAARESFASKGFGGTSIRGVARDAGVDAALVHHYFGGKDELFVASMALPVNPRLVAAKLLDGPREDLGRRLIETFLAIWESPGGQQRMKAVIRSAVSTDELARLLRDGITDMIVVPVSAALGLPDARLRVSLAASQLIGMAMMRYLFELEPLASASPAEVADRIGPVLQSYLTGPAPDPA